MQSIFRLPWCSESLGPKLSEKAALERMRATPVLEIPMLNKLKRKYSDSSDLNSLSAVQHSKKTCAEVNMVQRPPTADARLSETSETRMAHAEVQESFDSARKDSSISMPQEVKRDLPRLSTDNAPPVQPLDSTTSLSNNMAPRSFIPDLTGSLTPLQQVIENEFNMQILFKHNELRLIEQELAKCQIALEQLRRCELRPFPGTDTPSLDVTCGTGPAVIPPTGYTRPSHAAPYGITDGPYARHYRHWLLQDPQFDSTSHQAAVQVESAVHASGRPSRNATTARKASTKSLGSSRATDSLHSLPNYPAAPAKDKSAPLVLKRSTDGQFVKLICNNCHRGNFSSIQGFLNHCRIAHKVDYKSHDLAAIDCGRPLDENELANLPPDAQTSAPKPTVSRAPTVSHTPSRNLVHPLNTTVGAASTLLTPVSASSSLATPVASLGSPTSHMLSSSPFKPSAQVPRLSAHFAKRGVGGDLEQAASRAKQKIDLSAEDELLSPLTPDSTSPTTPLAGARTVGPSTNLSEAPRPPSRKGHRQLAVQRLRPSPLIPSGSFVDNEMVQSPQDHTSSASLSPNMVDSNPGLVSDHEDDDHGSASEEEASHNDMPHPPFAAVTRTCGDDMEIDVADDEELGQHGVIIRRNSMLAADARGLRNGGSPSRKMNLGQSGK